MIEKKTVCQIVDEWLEGKDYFLVEVSVSQDDKIVVEIDHAEGVWIEDCVDLSRYIESKLNREVEDYELEVGSAGIGQPFKVLQQYYIHIGQMVEVLTTDGRKLTGVLKEADDERFTVGVQKKVKPEGAKRPKVVEEDETFVYEQIKYTKYLINFK
ncbi:MAG: ribosome assembly cofactor RimP [Mediterranea sp.]|jgi:ribosome maturation factor RimP|nr:ribosome assembly cofactor RimP [Mediterranea sp.]